jgi:TorA maturation chaperone TorD
MMRQLVELRTALPCDEAGVAALAAAYDRVFGVPDRRDGAAQPHESRYRGATAEAAVRRFYLDAGLAKFDAAVPADHLGTELRFMALLCHGESAAWRAGRLEEARAALKTERGFLDRHLLTWAPACLDRLEGEARHDFYRTLAQAIRRIVHADRAVIDDVRLEGDRSS